MTTANIIATTDTSTSRWKYRLFWYQHFRKNYRQYFCRYFCCCNLYPQLHSLVVKTMFYDCQTRQQNPT